MFIIVYQDVLFLFMKCCIWIIFSVFIVGMLLFSFDQIIVLIVMLMIVGQLGGVDYQVWIIIVYLFVMIIVMFIYGKFGDVLGWCNFFLVVIVLFILVLVGCVFVIDFWMFVVFCVLQGFGGGGLMIFLQVIIVDIVFVNECGKYMGLLGVVFGFFVVVGLLFGGFFVDYMIWQWVFYINIFVGIVVFIIVFVVLKLFSKKVEKLIDIFGVIFFLIVMICLIFFIDFGGDVEFGWDFFVMWVWGVGFVVVVMVFVIMELCVQDLIILLSLFCNLIFVNVIVIGFVFGIGMFVVIGFVLIFLQMFFGIFVVVFGFLMILMMVGLMGMLIFLGIVILKIGRYKIYLIFGMIIIGIVMVLMIMLFVLMLIWLICIFLFVFGVGFGFIMQVVVFVVQNVVLVGEFGIVISMNNYFCEVGVLFGIVVFGMIFIIWFIENLWGVFVGVGVFLEDVLDVVLWIDLFILSGLLDEVCDGIVMVYVDVLVFVFWYFVLFIVFVFVFLFFLKQILLLDQVGLVVCGEVISGEEVECLEVEQCGMVCVGFLYVDVVLEDLVWCL